MKNKYKILMSLLVLSTSSCALLKKENKDDNPWKYEREILQDIVEYEPGTEKDAVVPEISAPKIKAIWVPERIENGILIEAHRQWVLEGETKILGFPKTEVTQR